MFIYVQLVLFTHSIGGLTIADFHLASALDMLPVVYSLNWKKHHPGYYHINIYNFIMLLKFLISLMFHRIGEIFQYHASC